MIGSVLNSNSQTEQVDSLNFSLVFSLSFHCLFTCLSTVFLLKPSETCVRTCQNTCPNRKVSHRPLVAFQWHPLEIAEVCVLCIKFSSCISMRNTSSSFRQLVSQLLFSKCESFESFIFFSSSKSSRKLANAFKCFGSLRKVFWKLKRTD